MRQLIVVEYGARLRTSRNQVLIEKKNSEKYNIPIHELEQIIIASSGVSISSKTVRKILEHGIDLVFLDSRGYPTGRIYPVYINKTVETRRKQYEIAVRGKGLDIAIEIVKAKILNQAGLLKRYYAYTRDQELRNAAEEVIKHASKISVEAPGSENPKTVIIKIEAEAARTYWSSYAKLVPKHLGFNNRDQDSLDPVNTSLNYLYGILYSESWKALVLAGLDPYLGYLHADRSGNPTLVFDYIEQFRFIADMTLLSMLRHGWTPKIVNGLLDYESRRKLITSLNTTLDETKTKYLGEAPISLRQVIKRNAFNLAAAVRGETAFKSYVHSW
ncbi:MAG: CRISPR-associated endonuclease Cas1 [Sulfolobales archaeon]